MVGLTFLGVSKLEKTRQISSQTQTENTEGRKHSVGGN